MCCSCQTEWRIRKSRENIEQGFRLNPDMKHSSFTPSRSTNRNRRTVACRKFPEPQTSVDWLIMSWKATESCDSLTDKLVLFPGCKHIPYHLLRGTVKLRDNIFLCWVQNIPEHFTNIEKHIKNRRVWKQLTLSVLKSTRETRKFEMEESACGSLFESFRQHD